MDPLGTLTSIFGLASALIAVVDKVQQNREECRRLATHVCKVALLIQGKCVHGLPQDVKMRLVNLSR